MSTVSLEFPIHVRAIQREGKRHYAVRPLFTGGPEGIGKRFERAVQKCTEQIRDTFRQASTSRTDIDDLLWFRFNPAIESKRFAVGIKTGVGTMAGPLLAAWFALGEETYVVLPGFDYHLFVARRGEQMQVEVERVALHLLRQERNLKEPPRPEMHLADESEFLATAATSVFVEGGKFPFESTDASSLFASMFKDATEFRGVVEIERTSRQLNRLFPEEIERAYGVDELVERTRKALFLESPRATVMIGPHGAGKTAILHEALARHLETYGPSADRAPRVWHLDPSRVIAGMRVVGQWQNRFEAILEYARDRMRLQLKIAGTDVLYTDNLVAMLRIGRSAQNRLTLADVLKPYLEKGEIPFVAEATPEAWKRVQEMDRGFADLFQVIRVAEPPRDTAIRIIAKQRALLERRYGASVENEALARLIDLQRSFPQRTAMPGCVVEIVKELTAKHRGATVDVAAVDAAFSGSSRLNARMFDPGVRLNERELRDFVETRLVGQPDASRCLMETIQTIKARLTRAEKPLGSFLFIGPTGVGKTEAAKVLAAYLFDDAESLLRFDMNEYIDGDAVGRLIGDAARPEGQLTNRVRHRPFCVLLFDEIEKAHESVHDLLLQVLGEGRLTDSAGRTVDFGNTIIILTSNLGAGEAGRSLGFARSTESRAAAYRQAVEDYFRPEFVNRLDRIVAFQPLALDDVMGIARLQIERLLARDGFVRRSTCLNVRAAALEEIARKGFDAEMGGRALKRSIERELTWMTAERLVTLPANQPVLFEVHLREGRLAPRVVGLPFTSQRCDAATIAPPEDRDLREFFEKLFDDTARIEETLAASRPAGPADPEYLLLKDRAFELRSRINDVLHALPRDEKAIPAFAFHWKGREKIYTEARIEGFDPNDLFAQIDIRDYLEEKYRGVRKEASAARSMAMESFVALAGLELQYRAYAAGKRDGVCLHIRSSVEKSRDALPKALARRYTELVKSLDPQFESFEEIAPSSDELYLVTSGPGLADFLQSEAGIHLFLAPYGTCTPVQVRVLTLADAVAPKEFVAADRQRRDDWLRAFEAGRATSEEDPWPPGEIVRIYARPGGDQEGTITDVRTGLMVPYGATGLPWFVWAYSNVGR